MKTHTILFILLLQLLYSCDNVVKPIDPIKPVEKWKKINTPAEYGLSDIEFLNNDFGVACGSFGTLLKTENEGQEWLPLNVGINSGLGKIFLLNENEFYVGTYGLYKTNDGGNTYTEAYPEGSVFDLHFFNSDTGLIYRNGNIYKTIDGCQNWDTVYEEAGLANIMQFVSDSVGYIAGGGSWDGMSSGALHKTIDGGNTWTDIGTSTGITNYEITAYYFINEDFGYLANYNKEFYITNDGGATWNLRCDSLPSPLLLDMVFLTEEEGYGVGFRNVIKTIDGGITWTEDYRDSTDVFYSSVTKTPDSTIFVVGNDGIILKKERQ